MLICSALINSNEHGLLILSLMYQPFMNHAIRRETLFPLSLIKMIMAKKKELAYFNHFVTYINPLCFLNICVTFVTLLGWEGENGTLKVIK